MKKMILNMKINVPDDFECGDCIACPLHTESRFENHFDVRVEVDCKLGCNKITCPLDESERR